MEWYELFLALFACFMLVLLGGMPVAFAMITSSMFIILLFFPHNVLSQVVMTIFRTSSNFALLTIPLFILMAGVLSQAGLTTELFVAMRTWFGHFPGGLGLASVAACTLFGAVCGSTAATTATLGLIAIPEMRKAGYNGTFATAIIASAGTLGTLIPPSNTAIVYGVITETSIGKVFIANIIPGLLLALMFMIFIAVSARVKPNLAPSTPRASWGERMIATKKVGAVILLIFLVFGSIYGGVSTPSEAAALGCVGALLIALVRKKLSVIVMKDIFLEVIKNSAAVMMLIVGTYLIGYVMIYGDIASHLTSAVLSISDNKWVIIIFVYILFIILGMLIEPLAIVCLVVPLIFPVLVQLGFDPIWIGVMTVVTSMIGNVSPPVGMTTYIAHGYAKDLSLNKLMLQVVPFVLVMFLHLGIITLFPGIALWLPSMMVN